MKVIILTEATGLIGQVLLKHFVASGDIIVGIDDHKSH